MKRVLLVFVGSLLALCVACVFISYFVAIPRAKKGVEEEVNQAVSTYVAPQIAGIGIAPKPGTYTLEADEVNQKLQAGGTNLKDMRFVITPNGLELRFGEQGQDVGYTAQVRAVDGRLDIEGADITGIPTWIIPTASVSKGLEQGINDYLTEHNLVLTSVTLQDGSMTLVLAAA